ncbi:hypothetical protein FACS1894176_03960 [Bacteroidia bacterium]|nr:hypothetical protein FACS1894176_03960 [Bacteroidia bacterium]
MAVFYACNENLVVEQRITEPPVINSFSPRSGHYGDQILISGENLLNVESVWIGGEPATITQLVNSHTIEVKVNVLTKTGVIRVKNSLGEHSTSDIFTVEYLTPTLEKYPAAGKINDVILLEGENMQIVNAVLFNKVAAEIIMQDRYSISVKVPYIESNKTDILLHYPVADGIAQNGTSGQPFTLIQATPNITDCPTSGTSGGVISILGENLDQIDKVLFGETEGIIVTQIANEMSVKVPEEQEEKNVVLKVVYHGVNEIILIPSFRLTVPSMIFRENITLYAQASENANMYGIINNHYYTPCEWADNAANIQLLMTAASEGMQICNPQWSSGYSKFKCDGSALSTAGTHIRFKKLYEDRPVENAYITQVKNRTLTYVSIDELIEQGFNLGSGQLKQVARYKDDANDAYNKGNDEGIYPGGVNMFVIYDSANNPLKVGFIELVSVSRTTAVDTYGSVTLNCYLQK